MISLVRDVSSRHSHRHRRQNGGFRNWEECKIKRALETDGENKYNRMKVRNATESTHLKMPM